MSAGEGDETGDNVFVAWPGRRDLNSFLCEACRTLDETGRREFHTFDARRQFVAQKLAGLKEKAGTFSTLVRNDALDVNGALVNSFTVSGRALGHSGYLSAAPYFFMRELIVFSYLFPVYLLTCGVEGAEGSDLPALQDAARKWAACDEPRRALEQAPVAAAHSHVQPSSPSPAASSLFPAFASLTALPPLSDILMDVFTTRAVAVPSNDVLQELQDLARPFAHPGFVHRVQRGVSERKIGWTRFASHTDVCVSHARRSAHIFGFARWCIEASKTMTARALAEEGERVGTALEVADMLITCVATACALIALRTIGYVSGEAHIDHALEALGHHEAFAELQGMLRSYECGPYYEFMAEEGETEEQWMARIQAARLLHAPDVAAVVSALATAASQAEKALATIEAHFPVAFEATYQQEARFAMRNMLAKGVFKHVAAPLPTAAAEYLIPVRFQTAEAAEVIEEKQVESDSEGGAGAAWVILAVVVTLAVAGAGAAWAWRRGKDRRE